MSYDIQSDRVNAVTEAFPRELEMLRDFYDTWVSYHTIPKDRTDSQSTVADYLIHVHDCIQQERNELAPTQSQKAAASVQ